jgi:hypothetical protein
VKVKKEGKKRVREDSEGDSEVEEVTEVKGRKLSEREKDVEWKRWVMMKLKAAEMRQENIERDIAAIGPKLDAIWTFLQKILGGPEPSDGATEEKSDEEGDEDGAGETLRDGEDGGAEGKESDDVEMVE